MRIHNSALFVQFPNCKHPLTKHSQVTIGGKIEAATNLVNAHEDGGKTDRFGGALTLIKKKKNKRKTEYSGVLVNFKKEISEYGPE